MQCLSGAICRCDAAAEIAFTAVMVLEGIKVISTICALLNAAGPLFSCLRHKLILQELMYFPCALLEVVAAKWRAGNGISYEVALGVCGAVRSCLSPHEV